MKAKAMQPLRSRTRIGHLTARAIAAVLTFTLLALTPSEAMHIQQIKTKKGIEVWLVEDHSRPILSLQFAFIGGAAQDPEGKAGLATFASSMLDEGAGPYDSQAFQKRMEDLAVKLSVSASHDNLTGTFQTLTQNREEAVKLLKLALTAPRFDAPDVERIREQLLAVIKADEKDPDKVANQAWSELAFGKHPYAQPVHGTLSTAAAITSADLHAFVRRNFARDNVRISAVGDADPETLSRIVDEVFGDLPEKAELAAVPEVAWPKNAIQKIVHMPNPQSVAQFGFEGLKRKDPDFIPAYILNYIVGGGGFASKLMHEVREKRGLAYSVYSYLNPMKKAGAFSGGVATENKRVAESLNVIRAELEKVASEGVTEQELRAAKDYLIGSFALRFDTSAKIAAQLTAIQLEELGIDYIDRRNSEIEAVTLEDVRRVAKRLLHTQNMIVTVVGEPEGIKEAGL